MFHGTWVDCFVFSSYSDLNGSDYNLSLQIFKNIDQNKHGRVSVFFCGPLMLAADLRRRCGEFNFEFSKESF